MRHLFSKDKVFYATLLRIAVPIIIQNFIASSLNMVDTIMVGQLGETEIASVGLANQVFFLLNLFLFGISSGAAIFTAQFWGKRDIGNIHKVLGLGLMSGVLVSLIFTFLAFLLPGNILAVFSKDPKVIDLGSQYLKIVCFSYGMTAITFSYAFILRSTEQVKLPMNISIIALSLNTLFNYLLIFGKFGFPVLGVRGAAIATVISRFVEMSLLLIIVYWKKYAPAARISEMLSFSSDFVKKFFYTTMPVILNESLWSLGVTMYMIVYARMGTNVVAAMNIESTVERISMVLFFGMASACAVMVGNQIGAGKEDTAFLYARKIAVLGPLMGVAMGAILILTSKGILSIYHVSENVYDNACTVLIIFAVTMSLRIFNTINIVGILRSGGDTRFSLFIDIGGVWLIGVPMAFLGGMILKLPIYWVYCLLSLEELFKFILGVKRVISKKWIHNLVKHIKKEESGLNLT